jgi:hypothetical protein
VRAGTGISNLIGYSHFVPIPRFRFDDASLGLPPQPVPVRYACLAADWSPSLLADLVVGFSATSPPMLAVREFASRRVSTVFPDEYREFHGVRPLKPENLAKLPPHHFVWSDDLVRAFSDLADLAGDRETAHLEKYYVNWEPELGPYLSELSSCADFSTCPPRQTACSIRRIHDVWFLRFEGSECAYPNEKGFKYLKQLLVVRDLHDDRDFSVDALNTAVNAPPPDSVGPSIVKASVMEQLRKDGAVIRDDAFIDAALPAADEQALEEVERVLSKYKDELSAAKDLSDRAHQEKLENNIKQLQDYLSANRNIKGRPRLVSGTSDKMRKAISAAIDRVVKSIHVQQPALASHLRTHIKKGRIFSYRPPESIVWTA